ncbi:hypothetical protein ACFPRA_01250 [Sporosarcina soli]|uniref:Portal protein n=1 Tax=Sporosarcina soli TaxID=334736 RepID=A0ABW0TFZ7_9BACL
MEIKPLTIYGYELITPKFENKSYDANRFDFELLANFFSSIINEIPLKERAFRDKNRMINLVSFNQSNDANLWEGVFTSARYGKEQVMIDVPQQIEKGIKPKDQGAKNEVHFLVDRRTGLLLLEKDSERVAGREIIKKFIRYHRSLIEPYLVAFNKQFDPVKIHRNSFLKIASLPNRTFFEEIKEFASIKEAYYYLDISERPSTSNEVSNLLYLENKAVEGGLKGVTRVKISFENEVKRGSVSGVEAYFKKLFEQQYFDGFGVSGKLDSGRQRNIELENIQRAFDISVEYNENGLPSLKDLLNEMSRIALLDNPLDYKKSIEQYKGVKVNDEEDGEV